MPYAQFLLAYRTGDGDDYAAALRSAYCFTDVAVDHAAKQVRMHGWPPVAFAQPMNRVLGTIAAYLETGDPYLLATAEAVVEASYRTHLNSWPRFAVGRDACYGRGAAMLYRYFGNAHFQRIARDCAMSVVQTQRQNGSFGDQGGGAGIHQWGGIHHEAVDGIARDQLRARLPGAVPRRAGHGRVRAEVRGLADGRAMGT